MVFIQMGRSSTKLELQGFATVTQIHLLTWCTTHQFVSCPLVKTVMSLCPVLKLL